MRIRRHRQLCDTRIRSEVGELGEDLCPYPASERSRKTPSHTDIGAIQTDRVRSVQRYALVQFACGFVKDQDAVVVGHNRIPI